MSDSNAQYRNSVFCSYFNDHTRLLSLCNAVLNKNYSNPSELEITTLEGIFFDNRKNDISCKIRNNFLVLIEHQSSVNFNMPFRCLSYVAELMNKLVNDKRELYRKKLIRFPSPKFFVLYDGNDDEPLEKTMRLSEAFDDTDVSLELIVTVLNINFGLNPPILKKCSYLNDYSTLVSKVKSEIALGLSRRDAIIRAVKKCINKGVMRGYLETHAEEVFTMLALEWDIDEAKKAWHADGFEASLGCIEMVGNLKDSRESLGVQKQIGNLAGNVRCDKGFKEFGNVAPAHPMRFAEKKNNALRETQPLEGNSNQEDNNIPTVRKDFTPTETTRLRMTTCMHLREY